MRLRSRSGTKEETQKQDDAMSWTVTNLVIEVVAGIIGAHAISAAAKEHSSEWLGIRSRGPSAERLAAISYKP